MPDAEKTAQSLGGETRNPDHLTGRDAVKYQDADGAASKGLATEGHNCENCAEFVPDGNGDGYGACVKVEGYIGPEDWCTLWEATDSS
ncbi:MAG: high-potential iron-sulfur protein [Halanaeroarchaeum sp.]